MGLGNPGPEYEKTRHNLGFTVVRALGSRLGWSFQRERKVEGEIATGVWEEKKLYLLLPDTYMNHSGRAVEKTVGYYKISVQTDTLLVVMDDVAIPFGKLRFRSQGSSGGHNGLKSIQESGKAYLPPHGDIARLRIGIGSPTTTLTDYVLGKFTPEEENSLPQIVADGVEVIECWLKGGPVEAIQRINQLARSKKNE